jgi:hypothetical protein
MLSDCWKSGKLPFRKAIPKLRQSFGARAACRRFGFAVSGHGNSIRLGWRSRSQHNEVVWNSRPMSSPLTIPYKNLQVVITAESPDIPRYDARSVDNKPGSKADEHFIEDNGYRASSRHRIAIKDGLNLIISRVLLANGGASGVHEHSAFLHGDTGIIAVGPFACALQLPSLELLWHSRVDTATCFGVCDAPNYSSFVSHGELEIARVTYKGEIVWARAGRDIFSGDFAIGAHHAEAVDFNEVRYRFDLKTGDTQHQ